MRMTLAWLAVTMGLMLSAAPAHANMELITAKNCLACHQVEKRKYGPNFKVAAKCADQKNAVNVLARKIRKGGTGVWGQDIMPPQPQVSAKEAREIATYVLSLK
jgi:cytochrome c